MPGAGFRQSGRRVSSVDGDGCVDLAAHEDVAGRVAEGAGLAVGGGGFGLGHDWFLFDFLIFCFWFSVLGLPSVPEVFCLIDRLESVRSMLKLMGGLILRRRRR